MASNFPSNFRLPQTAAQYATNSPFLTTPQTYTDASGRQVSVYQPTNPLISNFLEGQDVATQRRADPGAYLQDTYNWMTKNLGSQAGDVGSYQDAATKGMTYGQRAEYYNPFLQYGNQGFDVANWYNQGRPVMDQAVSQGYTGGNLNFGRTAPNMAPSTSLGAAGNRPAAQPQGWGVSQGTAPTNIFNAQPTARAGGASTSLGTAPSRNFVPTTQTATGYGDEGPRPSAGYARPASPGAMNLAEVPPDVDTMPSEDWRRRPGWGVTIGLGRGGGGGGGGGGGASGTPGNVEPPVRGTTGRSTPGGLETGSDATVPSTTDTTGGAYGRAIPGAVGGSLGTILSRTGGEGVSQSTPTAQGGQQQPNWAQSFSNLGGNQATDQQNQFLQAIMSYLNPMIQNGQFYNPQQSSVNNLSNMLSNYPNWTSTQNQAADITNLGNLGGSMAGTQSDWLGKTFQPTMNQKLQDLNQYGLPGTQQAQGVTSALNTMGGNLLGTGDQYGVQQLLQQIMSGGLPNQQGIQNMTANQLGQANQLQGGQGSGSYGTTDLLSQIMNSGLPGQKQIEGLVGSGLGQTGSVYGQAGGTAEQGNYGLIPMLQQIMQSGLPGQSDITGLISSLSQSSQQGGMTPEQRDAYTRLIYDPMQERLVGDLNKMGGGQVNLGGSGQMQELQRRSNQAFQDTLLTKAMENASQQAGQATNAFGTLAGANSPYAQLAAQLGQQGTQNALQAFTAVPGAAQPYIAQAGQQGQNAIQNALAGYTGVASSVYPYANLASSTGLGALNQANQNYQTTNNLGLQNLSTIQNLAYQPYTTGWNQANQAYTGAAGIQNDALSQLQNFINSQQGNYNQQTAQGTDTLNTLLGGIFGTGAAGANMSAANKQMLGQIIGSGVQSLPAILKLFGIG